MLRDGIKFAVATRDEKFFDVPCLDSKGGKVYGELRVPVFERCGPSLPEISSATLYESVDYTNKYEIKYFK